MIKVQHDHSASEDGDTSRDETNRNVPCKALLAHARKCSGRWLALRSDARVELLLLVEKVCVRPQLLDVDPLSAKAENALDVDVLEAELAVHVVHWSNYKPYNKEVSYSEKLVVRL